MCKVPKPFMVVSRILQKMYFMGLSVALDGQRKLSKRVRLEYVKNLRIQSPPFFRKNLKAMVSSFLWEHLIH